MSTALRTGTTATFGQVPLWSTGDPMYTQQRGARANYLLSANMPMIYQIRWTGGDVNEFYVPKVEGDLVNVVFSVYVTTGYPSPSSLVDWELIGKIKKTRDLPNTNIVNSNLSSYQSFSVDISSMVQDQLSYSLCPIGKGSWQSNEYGGMNGGPIHQDNVVEAVSPYNVTRNGTYRTVRVQANYEVLDANLQIVISSTASGQPAQVRAINSLVKFGQMNYYYALYKLDDYGISRTIQKRALTACPNQTVYISDVPEYKKPVMPDSQGEFLQFFMRTVDSYNSSYTPNTLSAVRYEVYGKAFYTDSTDAEFVLGSTWSYPINNNAANIGERIQSDLSHTFVYETGTDKIFDKHQYNMSVQNVSAGYIDEHAYPPQDADYPYTTTQFSPINHASKTCTHYHVYVRGLYKEDDGTYHNVRKSNVYWYSIDRDTNDAKKPNEYVKFYWLNCKGGIDTYTAKRNILHSLSISKDTFKTDNANKRYFQEDSDGSALTIKDYYSDTMRGFDTYKGGLQVSSVNAQEANSVYTEPLSYTVSKWLSEIFTSPNVWIEDSAETNAECYNDYSRDFPYYMNDANPTLRPKSKIYKPIIITNSEVVTMDEENGLVSFNIEYTTSSGLKTQRN